MQRHSETMLVWALLPIFVIGMPAMLLIGLLGFAGLVVLGILLVCVGLSEALRTDSDYNERVIVGGFVPPAERAMHLANRRASTRFVASVMTTGGCVVAAGLLGFLCLG